MGGGDYHLGEKPDSIFSLCQNIGLSLFGVCLFFGGFWCIEKLGLPREKKLLAGRLGLDPLFVVLELPAVQKDCFTAKNFAKSPTPTNIVKK